MQSTRSSNSDLDATGSHSKGEEGSDDSGTEDTNSDTTASGSTDGVGKGNCDMRAEGPPPKYHQQGRRGGDASNG